MTLRSAALALVCLLFSVSSSAWWNPDWTSRKTIAIDTTATGLNLTSAATDVPVLLRLHSGNFPQFLNVLDGGADFRVIAADDQTPLKYHVEKFDPAAQIALIWVKVPSLAPQSADNKIYLYFGNPAAPRAEDAANTFDPGTAAVLHFADPSGTVTDSTAYATTAAGPVLANPASLIGNGASLAGTEALQIVDAPQLRLLPESGWGVSLWFKVDTAPTEPAYLIDRADGEQRLSLMIVDGHLVARYGTVEVIQPAAVVAGQWTHAALSVAAGQLELFVNGLSAGQAPVVTGEMGGPLYLGGGSDGTGLLAMHVDELRVFSQARAPAYFAAQAAVDGERNDAALSYGADETPDQAGGEAEATTGHFGTIIQFVFGSKDAIVEQVVILVCVGMAGIAILVMFMKAVYLARCRRASDRFLSAYRTQVTSTTLDSLLQGHQVFGDSPLFKVYHQGIDEVRSRLADRAGGSLLEEKSLNAIRATLDATMVRENQRMNALLVLLTIAISGGPFIGLLGTVVGVMVTFATIASTGDVNISAIAPGMAAALLATVAGLGVAIPALFGYNYLGSKAKELVADMHVFADEFIARLNEVHGA